MVDWNDPDLEAKLGVLSVQLLYAIFGLYSWEYIRSSHVEIALLRRQLPFRWPLLSYITARFSFLIAIILHVTVSSPFYIVVDCQSINFVIIFSTNVAIGCSTTNLMIRTWLIWKTSLLRLLLILLSLGHWTLLTLFVATIRASTINGVCMIDFVNPAYASAVLIYVMLYDLALLVFTVIGLLRMPSPSTLWKTLVKQGVVYFICSFLANLILLALARLNLNMIMNVIFGAPVGCICTIASSKVVLSLLRPPSNYESDSTSLAKVHPLTTNFTVTAPWSPSVSEAQETICIESRQVLHDP
ncbi:hypothetical protein BDR03DRAFT_950174 [Suillus americanus]|nr:hypothetical protein BDR03DRAFT_950174 [Suillus americanus]